MFVHGTLHYFHDITCWEVRPSLRPSSVRQRKKVSGKRGGYVGGTIGSEIDDGRRLHEFKLF